MEGFKHNFDPANLTTGYLKLQNLNKSLEKEICVT